MNPGSKSWPIIATERLRASRAPHSNIGRDAGTHSNDISPSERKQKKWRGVAAAPVRSRLPCEQLPINLLRGSPWRGESTHCLTGAILLSGLSAIIGNAPPGRRTHPCAAIVPFTTRTFSPTAKAGAVNGYTVRLVPSSIRTVTR